MPPLPGLVTSGATLMTSMIRGSASPLSWTGMLKIKTCSPDSQNREAGTIQTWYAQLTLCAFLTIVFYKQPVMVDLWVLHFFLK